MGEGSLLLPFHLTRYVLHVIEVVRDIGLILLTFLDVHREYQEPTQDRDTETDQQDGCTYDHTYPNDTVNDLRECDHQCDRTHDGDSDQQETDRGSECTLTSCRIGIQSNHLCLHLGSMNS